MSEREHLTSSHPRPHEAPATVPERVILILLAVILPPLPIFLLNNYSIFNREFFVSVLLTIFGHIPGTVFSIYYILVEYPRVTHAAQTNSGYVRLNDDDEANVPEDSTTAAPGSHNHHQEHHEHDEHHEHEQPQAHDDNNEPPSYEAVAGPSNDATSYPADVKGGSTDNKVQH